MYLPLGHPSEQIWRNFAFLHLVTNGCTTLQWMGAVKWEFKLIMRDKNITISCTITKNISPSINIVWSKKLHVCNKQIHQDYFNFLTIDAGKNMSPLYIILLFFQWKSYLVWIWRELCTDQAPFTSEKSPKQFQINMRGQQGTFHWRKRYGLIF